MSLKENILRLLSDSHNKYISGESMAESYNVSRNAVWKAVNSLRKQGYNINAVQNKGYILEGPLFTAEEIKNLVRGLNPIMGAYTFLNGKKVKFSGKVVQVIEGSGDDVQIRLAVNDDYDTILFGQYSSDIVSSRVLEDDYITIYGMSVGTISYESTMGGTITIPGVYIDKIEQ